MEGLFITFEGTEGSGKSTQVQLLARRLSDLGRTTITLREPGGTPIGEEIRTTLKHSDANHAMCPETELLLMNAARAQLVRQVIRPALCKGEIVLCDRFFDSTIAYQAYGRGLDMGEVMRTIDFAIDNTRPTLTLLLRVPIEVSESRRSARTQTAREVRDRFEEADRAFFQRVEHGYDQIADAGGSRVRTIDATQTVEIVEQEIWRWVEPLIRTPMAEGERAYKSIGEYRQNSPG